jgi:hypothetical protein
VTPHRGILPFLVIDIRISIGSGKTRNSRADRGGKILKTSVFQKKIDIEITNMEKTEQERMVSKVDTWPDEQREALLTRYHELRETMMIPAAYSKAFEEVSKQIAKNGMRDL